MREQNFYNSKISKIDFINYTIISIMFSLFLIMWLQINIYLELAQIFPLIVFILLTILVVSNSNRIIVDKKISLIIFLITITSIIGILINNSNIGTLFGILNLCIIFLISPYIQVNIEIIKVFSILSLLGLIYWSFIPPEGFNTNSIGIITLVFFIFSQFLLESIKKKLFKIPIIIFTIIISWNSVITSESRASLIGLVFFIILNYLIPYRILYKKIVIKFLVCLVTVGSIGYVFLYIKLWQINYDLVWSYSDKSLYTGRELIWIDLWNAFKESYFFGLGSNYQLQTHDVLNVHNSMFHILTIYGIIVFILALTLIYYFFTNKVQYKIGSNPYYGVALSGFLSLSLQSFFETTLVSSSFTPIIIVFLIIMSSLPEFKK
ncbi:hypothetical protein ESP131_00015 [Exiguobacterium sp. U13-1]|uniref:O-antigen ligase family protein n=1 Tax=Exiguobacterium sp. U13-1 TaxID=1849031 RepID=UPI0008596CA8|nr:O-antigen ligase family protein [Exiguobacterium sp. U13-1]AOS98776.1 hypothetical protein ESP131_00015 [Exiguobacterium sp. U13-1]